MDIGIERDQYNDATLWLTWDVDVQAEWGIVGLGAGVLRLTIPIDEEDVERIKAAKEGT